MKYIWTFWRSQRSSNLYSSSDIQHLHDVLDNLILLYKAWSLVRWVGDGSWSGIGCLSKADPERAGGGLIFSTIICDVVHLFCISSFLIGCRRSDDHVLRCFRQQMKRGDVWRSGTGTAAAASRRRLEFGRPEADLVPNSGWSGTPIRCAGKTCAGRPSALGSGQTAWSHKAEGSIGKRGPWTAKRTQHFNYITFSWCNHIRPLLMVNTRCSLIIDYINANLWYCLCVRHCNTLVL